jgi:hypothetical protein
LIWILQSIWLADFLLYLITWIKKCIYIFIVFLHRNTIDGWFMVLNATFNNISVISCRSVLLVEATEVPEENHQPVASHWQTCIDMAWFELSTLVVISTDCTCSCKSNYHTISTTTVFATLGNSICTFNGIKLTVTI